MTFKDYCISRPTEVPEIDVYVCECKYVESEKLIRKITKTVPKVKSGFQTNICVNLKIIHSPLHHSELYLNCIILVLYFSFLFVYRGFSTL